MSIRTILRDNLRQLIAYHKYIGGEFPNQLALGKLPGVSQASVSRIMKRAHSPNIEMIEVIARAYDLQAWQLLMPGLDPANPPTILVTETERALYRRLREVADELKRIEGGSR